MRYVSLLLIAAVLAVAPAWSQTHLLPDRVFDGEAMHEGWSVLVRDGVIEAVGADLVTPAGAQRIELSGQTLLPGFIEAHAHVLLHPYDETPWNDQVLVESIAERSIRAANHARETLLSGFTTVRDLGTEGADYADVGVRDAIDKGVIPGPTLLVAGRALVATGSYGPKGFRDGVAVPLGAEPADGGDLIRATRDQIGHGIDVVKVYADYRWGPSGEARPTFSREELTTIVEVAASSGRPVAAHAATEEGMRRAVLAGAQTIEHGDGGTPEVWALMAERGVVLYPTLGAVDAIEQYNGWRPGVDPDPARIAVKKAAFRQALEAGVTIGVGSDVGVFSHGTSAREMRLMAEYGMPSLDVLKAATSVNADALHLADRGRIRRGLRADLVAVSGNPAEDIAATANVGFVMQAGRIVRE